MTHPAAAKRVEIIGNATLYLGDCSEVLPDLSKVDAVITDPPYGINVGSMSMGTGKKATGFARFDWDSQAPGEQLIRALLNSANVSIIWGGNYFSLPPSGCWLAWDKVQKFSGADLELAWTNLTKPTKAFRMSRIEAYGSIQKQHPTQKPVELMSWCIDQAGNPHTILDPFMGSGTTGVAAIQMGRRFIGIEKELTYFDIACKRIEQAAAQSSLFEASFKPAQPYEQTGISFDFGGDNNAE